MFEPKVGMTCVTRNGQKVGPLYAADDGNQFYPLRAEGGPCGTLYYTASGSCNTGNGRSGSEGYDLVAEWVEQFEPKVGMTCVTRDGQKVGPLIYEKGNARPWRRAGLFGLWYQNGRFFLHEESPLDLVGEWVEPQVDKPDYPGADIPAVAEDDMRVRRAAIANLDRRMDDLERRNNELLEANNALLERARAAEEGLYLMREFAIRNVAQWLLGSAHYHPIWEHVAEILHENWHTVDINAACRYRFIHPENRETLEALRHEDARCKVCEANPCTCAEDLHW